MITFEYTYVALTTSAHYTTVVPFVFEPRLVRIVDPAGSDAPVGSPARTARTMTIDFYPHSPLPPQTVSPARSSRSPS